MAEIRIKQMTFWECITCASCATGKTEILVINGKRITNTGNFDYITPREADALEKWRKHNIKDIPTKLLVVIDNLLAYVRSVEKKGGIEEVAGFSCLKQPLSHLKH